MSFDSYDSDRYSSDIYTTRKMSRDKEITSQRKLERYREISESEVREKGSELLSKIVKALPKKINEQAKVKTISRTVGDGVIFTKKGLAIRITLSIKPIGIVDYVVGAFQTKGWGAVHSFDDVKCYDHIDLTLPDDWLKRVLCIGRYAQTVSEPKEEESKL